MKNYNFFEKNNNVNEKILEFSNYMGVMKGRSEKTVAGYQIDLDLFLRFLACSKGIAEDVDTVKSTAVTVEMLQEVELSDMHNFLSWSQQVRKNGAAARARKVSALRQFFKYLNEVTNVITVNPALRLETPKLGKKNPVHLSLEESKKLVKTSSEKGRNSERNNAIITIFLNCGLRVSELCGIKLENIKGDTLLVTGKGNKERMIYLNEACLNAIKAYKKVRNKNGKADKESLKFLFLSERGKQINKCTVERIVKNEIKAAGLDDKKYSCHKLRHTCATILYKEAKVDIRLLKDILGHESIATTQIYTHTDSDSIRAAMKSNPLAGIL